MFISPKFLTPFPCTRYDGTNAAALDAVASRYGLVVVTEPLVVTSCRLMDGDVMLRNLHLGDVLVELGVEGERKLKVITAAEVRDHYRIDAAAVETHRARVFRHIHFGPQVAMLATPYEPLDCTVVMDQPYHLLSGFVLITLYRDDYWHVLVSQRRAPKSYADHYQFPGGKIDENEPVNFGAVREVAEETGLMVNAAALRLVLRQPQKKPEGVTLHHFFRVDYNVEMGVPANIEPEKATDWEWVRADELLHRCHLGQIKLIPGMATALRTAGLVRD